MERTEEKTTVGEIVATLREAVKIGNLQRSFASPLYNSLQKYYQTTTEAPDDWRNIVFSRADFNARMERFKNNYKEEKTAFAYKARARRAIEVYGEQRQRQSAIAIEGENESTFIKNLRLYWKKALISDLEDEKKNNYIEVIQCKTRGSGVAAIVVSRDAFLQDMEEMRKTIESMLNGKL